MLTRIVILSVLFVAGIKGIEQGRQLDQFQKNQMTAKMSFKANSLSSRSPASASEAKRVWSFEFKDLAKRPFQIKKEASSYEEAYKLATKDCFQRLTGGSYPGEEKGLDIIDICVNPKI